MRGPARRERIHQPLVDVPMDDENDGPGMLARRLGTDDDAFEKIENLEALKPLVAALSGRDRTILSLRFATS